MNSIPISTKPTPKMIRAWNQVSSCSHARPEAEAIRNTAADHIVKRNII